MLRIVSHHSSQLLLPMLGTARACHLLCQLALEILVSTFKTLLTLEAQTLLVAPLLQELLDVGLQDMHLKDIISI